jgi:rod shape-determining protein MreD
MINIIGRNILRLIFLVLLQVLILNEIRLFDEINPYLYLLFILLLPFETPKWALLIMGFALGLTIDVFSNSLGLHTSATVLVAYLRQFILQVFAPRDGYETGTFPRAYYYGFGWFTKYVVLLILIHQSVLYFLEAYSFENAFETLRLIVIGTIFTTILVVMSQLFMYRR